MHGTEETVLWSKTLTARDIIVEFVWPNIINLQQGVTDVGQHVQ